MNVPSPILLWIGVIGGCLGIITSALNFYLIWRNRRRILFSVVSAELMYQPWKDYDIKVGDGTWPGPPGYRNPKISEGDWKRSFTVLEFVVKNTYPTDVSVGRFRIDNWMFLDKFVPGMYAFKRDYRVFDLQTQKPTSLEKYTTVPPGGSFGLRIEVLEEAEGPAWKSNHTRYKLEPVKSYCVEFRTDEGLQKHKVKIQSAELAEYGNFYVHCWSDILGDLRHPSTSGHPRPQGLKPPIWKDPLRIRFRNWYRSSYLKLLYGKPYRSVGDETRIQRYWREFLKIFMRK